VISREGFVIVVMPGLVPGIHVLGLGKDVDDRAKPGHDEENSRHFAMENDINPPC
jgi:hypothetical protein